MNKIFIVILLKEVTAVLHKRASSEYVHPLSGELLPRQWVHIFMGSYSQTIDAYIHGELLPRQWVHIFMGSYFQTMGAHIHGELLPDNRCTYSWEVTPQTMGAHIHGELLPRQWVHIFMGS